MHAKQGHIGRTIPYKQSNLQHARGDPCAYVSNGFEAKGRLCNKTCKMMNKGMSKKRTSELSTYALFCEQGTSSSPMARANLQLTSGWTDADNIMNVRGDPCVNRNSSDRLLTSRTDKTRGVDASDLPLALQVSLSDINFIDNAQGDPSNDTRGDPNAKKANPYIFQ
eukprot:9260030-Karenia_brevis.AAC.1